jgi:Flp pilus assembly protein TadB
MAATDRKSRPRLYSQAISLNVAVAALLIAVVLQPTWQAVVGLIAVLGALCFRWTQEHQVADETKRTDELAEQVKTLSIRLGNLAFKTGCREK